MPKNNKSLLLKVMARLGELSFVEEWIPSYQGAFTYGENIYDGKIKVNPMPHVVDTVIHECLHEMFPKYSERAIRSLTGKLMKKLSEEELQSIYGEYKRKLEGD